MSAVSTQQTLIGPQVISNDPHQPIRLLVTTVEREITLKMETNCDADISVTQHSPPLDKILSL